MKLYIAPGACSISPHIALIETGLPFELVKVDFMRGKATSDGSNWFEVNPKGYVPALVLDSGAVLTEGAIMVQYIADLAPESGLAPKFGTLERLRLAELLHFIATEIHKGVGPLLSPLAGDEYKQAVRERVAGRFALLARQLGDKPWLMGDQFTVADGYAFYVLRFWQTYVKQTLSPELEAYWQRLVERPSVRAALAAEGLQPR